MRTQKAMKSEVQTNKEKNDCPKIGGVENGEKVEKK